MDHDQPDTMIFIVTRHIVHESHDRKFQGYRAMTKSDFFEITHLRVILHNCLPGVLYRYIQGSRIQSEDGTV